MKWAGGKQQLLAQFDEKFPKKIDHYAEPFLGGGAVFFYVLKYKQPKSARAYDSNKELINVYLQVKNNVQELIKELSLLEKEHNINADQKSYYYKKRDRFNHLLKNRKNIKNNQIKKAALFIYLNKTCFNGLYRVNSRGEFNVPFNGSKNISLFNQEDILEANELLNKSEVKLEAKDFKEIKFYKKEVIYFDPPYWSEPEKGFTSYTNPDFNKDSQEKLATTFKKLFKEGCKIILSNSKSKFIKEIYDHPKFNYNNIEARRMINCNGDGRHKINELLITANF